MMFFDVSLAALPPGKTSSSWSKRRDESSDELAADRGLRLRILIKSLLRDKKCDSVKLLFLFYHRLFYLSIGGDCFWDFVQLSTTLGSDLCG